MKHVFLPWSHHAWLLTMPPCSCMRTRVHARVLCMLASFRNFILVLDSHFGIHTINIARQRRHNTLASFHDSREFNMIKQQQNKTRMWQAAVASAVKIATDKHPNNLICVCVHWSLGSVDVDAVSFAWIVRLDF